MKIGRDFDEESGPSSKVNRRSLEFASQVMKKAATDLKKSGGKINGDHREETKNRKKRDESECALLEF